MNQLLANAAFNITSFDVKVLDDKISIEIQGIQDITVLAELTAKLANLLTQDAYQGYLRVMLETADY